jgi:hypothetical protein
MTPEERAQLQYWRRLLRHETDRVLLGRAAREGAVDAILDALDAAEAEIDQIKDAILRVYGSEF